MLVGQISDRAGAGKLWISDPIDFDPVRIAGLSLRYGKLGSPLTEGSSRNVIGGPLGATQNTVQAALRYGAPFRAGQWIASGGLVPAVEVARGDIMVMESSLGALRLTLT